MSIALQGYAILIYRLARCGEIKYCIPLVKKKEHFDSYWIFFPASKGCPSCGCLIEVIGLDQAVVIGWDIFEDSFWVDSSISLFLVWLVFTSIFGVFLLMVVFFSCTWCRYFRPILGVFSTSCLIRECIINIHVFHIWVSIITVFRVVYGFRHISK